MRGRPATGFVPTSFARARRFGVRLAHRLATIEPLDGGSRPAVAITGGGGTIGRVLREGLREAYAVRTIDVAPGSDVDVVADTRRVERTRAAFSGADAVVDLAANANLDASWDDVSRNNIAATVATLEAARRAGVGRVVFASSNHVTGMYERDEPYASVVEGRLDGLDPASLPRVRAGSPVRPDSFYAVGKAAGEAAGRYYADVHGLSVICLRIGSVSEADRPRKPRDYATFLSHRDLVQLVRRCLEAPAEVRFAIFYGVSGNTWRIWDIEDARETLGYEPADDAESFR